MFELIEQHEGGNQLPVEQVGMLMMMVGMVGMLMLMIMLMVMVTVGVKQ